MRVVADWSYDERQYLWQNHANQCQGFFLDITSCGSHHMELSLSGCTITSVFTNLPSASEDLSFPQILPWYTIIVLFHTLYTFMDSEIAIAVTSHVKNSDWHWNWHWWSASICRRSTLLNAQRSGPLSIIGITSENENESVPLMLKISDYALHHKKISIMQSLLCKFPLARCTENVTSLMHRGHGLTLINS